MDRFEAGEAIARQHEALCTESALDDQADGGVILDEQDRFGKLELDHPPPY
jgi:hypothetical protein